MIANCNFGTLPHFSVYAYIEDGMEGINLGISYVHIRLVRVITGRRWFHLNGGGRKLVSVTGCGFEPL